MMTTSLVGKTLGQYQLIKVIGEGGLATVYKAYQPSLERWIAVKVLYAANDTELLARFQREAKAAARLRHRNILIVYEYGEAEGWPYIAMDLVEGGTLADYLHNTTLDWTQGVNLAIGIAEALHYAHQHDVIHRDVKPSNILMAQQDWPLLADFGLVKVADADRALTQTGLAMGTPTYIPPEQAQGEKVDHRADMYSLGVILFEMITGRLPFQYENPNLLMLAHISEPVPSPRAFNPACPPELEQVILRAMQKSPHDRYPDLQAMVDALEHVVSISTSPVAGTGPAFAGSAARLSTISVPEMQAGQDSGQNVRILLVDQNITLDLPDPGEDGLIIGRTHGQRLADIDLGPYGAAKAGVSRQHAFLIRLGSDWLLDDLNSLNGTYVNELKLTPDQPVPLKNGDVIRCSRLSFIFLLA